MASVAQPIPAALAPSRPAATIVPVKLLPVVGVVLVGLVTAIATDSQWALDFFHVAGGGLWTGIDLFVGLVLGPIMGMMSIPSRLELSSRLMPKLLLIVPTLVTMTLGSGFQLARKVGNLAANYPQPRVARRLLHRGRGDGGHRPRPARAGEPRRALRDAQAEPRTARIGSLMKVFIYTAGITGLMQVATLVIMTKLASG